MFIPSSLRARTSLNIILAAAVSAGGLYAVGCGGGSDEPSDVPSTADTGVDTALATDPDTATADALPDAPVDAPADAPTKAARTTPTTGSAIAITRDDKFAVAANRTAGTVTVAPLAAGTAAPFGTVTAIDLGADAEPWAVVIGNDDDTAYVITRKHQTLRRVTGLKSKPTLDAAVAKLGSEPTGIAISPTGAELYVANWAEGTVTVVRTGDLTVARTIDLNAALASSGMLGTGVAGRPGLAHPRALVVSNDGDSDDADETLYVTEFFSQTKTGALPSDDSKFDVGRQGVVYRVKISDGSVSITTIAPVVDTGFKDAAGNVTGCFPNQLFAAALDAGRLYVTAVCESPRGPVGPVVAGGAVNPANFKTELHSSIFVIDTATANELPEQAVVMTKAFQKLYDDAAIADDGSRRVPLIPTDLVFAPGTHVAYVTSYGSDAVFRVAFKDDGSLKEVGAAAQRFINLAPAGALPVGIATTNAGVAASPFAVVINENSRNLSLLSLATQTVSATVESTAQPESGEARGKNRGQKFFATGLGRWSFKGQGWNSCAGCHPDGLTDNVTWYFARGPRQTTSLDGSYDPKDPSHRRVMNWTGIFDEVHDFELNTRGNSGGLGAAVWKTSAPPSADDRIVFDGTAVAGAQKATATPQAGLNGSVKSLMPRDGVAPCADSDTTCNRSVLADWDEIDAYVISVRAPRAPTNLAAADVAAGKALFEANNCAACHGSSHWTTSRVFYAPNETNNAIAGLLRDPARSYTLPAGFPSSLNPPANNASRKATLRFADVATAGANDQLNCVLRDVGTFGTAPSGVFVKEVRADMTATAQGATGFNVPSLLGMVTGAPYFHAGNARTLEEAFSTVFERHHQAHSTLFTPNATQVRQLVAYVLAIDEDLAPIAVPTSGTITFDPVLCPKTFP